MLGSLGLAEVIAPQYPHVESNQRIVTAAFEWIDSAEKKSRDASAWELFFEYLQKAGELSKADWLDYVERLQPEDAERLVVFMQDMQSLATGMRNLVKSACNEQEAQFVAIKFAADVQQFLLKHQELLQTFVLRQECFQMLSKRSMGYVDELFGCVEQSLDSATAALKERAAKK